ncbi:hypothetical protein HELRODRAFT_171920 [Helobdella robusta]|uniref:Uncharacterized protein n=1 Tax=Helobdella robusta TaxID=6412 RepID=T1F4U9_HELRO|nr:hypothetical protein HELRODRAFT_171920 [Helobdella robusta]ESO04918.1 hypothetical protein HELRODRAFT_171920 [Helobdella robusta]
MSVDNELRELYVNGLNIPVVPATFPNALLWNVPDTYKLTCRVLYVLAIKGWNNGHYGGLVVSTPDNYILTNKTWKCNITYHSGWYKIKYDDSLWPVARYGSAQGDSSINSQLSPIVKWIIDPTDCLNCIFYCVNDTLIISVQVNDIRALVCMALFKPECFCLPSIGLPLLFCITIFTYFEKMPA